MNSPLRSFFRRVVAIYQGIALVAFSSLLLTVLVLVLLDLAMPAENYVWEANLGGRRLSDQFVSSHYYLAEPDEIAETKENFDAYVAAGHWQAHPWTGLINRQFASTHLNIGPAGRRQGEPSRRDPGGVPFRVWAFGGSTLFGWGLADRWTIPSQLQAELGRLLPGRSVEVVNFGVPWFNSSLEASLFVSALRDSSQGPDLALFFDGLNDLVHATHYHSLSPLFPHLSAAWESHLEDLRGGLPWIRVQPTFPLARMFHEPSTSLGGEVSPQSSPPGGSWVERATDVYARNRRVISRVAEDAGATVLFALQPVPMWLDESRRRTTDPDYRRFSEASLSLGPLFDLRDALSALGPARAMSVEDGGAHYSDAASRLLARRLAREIAAISDAD